MSIVREEIFGPVLSVMKFSDDSLDDLAARANDHLRPFRLCVDHQPRPRPCAGQSCAADR
jgi:hypothetical protein